MNLGLLRTRWAAVGAAVAVTLGAGGLGITHATSPAGAAAFVPITPCRLTDTRPAPDNIGPRSTPIGPGDTLTISAHGSNGSCTGIPNTATGLSLNVTAIGATSGSFLTIWPTDAPRPGVSSLNPQPGAPPIPNAVTTGISAGGQFNIFNGLGSVNVIVDVVGYYTDHNHDDRYYTKAEVDAISPDVFTTSGGIIDFPAVADTAIDVATLDVPAGNYLVNASLVANNNETNVVFTGCTLTLGGVVIANMFDTSSFPLSATGTGGERESIALVGAGTVDAPSTVQLVCQTTSTSGNYLAPSIVATTVASVTTQS